jgi:hypothetical protein
MYHQPPNNKIVPFHFTNKPPTSEVKRGGTTKSPDSQRKMLIRQRANVLSDEPPLSPSSPGTSKPRQRFLTIDENEAGANKSPTSSVGGDGEQPTTTTIAFADTPPRSPRGRGRRGTLATLHSFQSNLKRRISAVGKRTCNIITVPPGCLF